MDLLSKRENPLTEETILTHLTGITSKIVLQKQSSQFYDTISIYQMTSYYQVLSVCSKLCSNKKVAN